MEAVATTNVRVVGRFRPINGREKEEAKRAGQSERDIIPVKTRTSDKAATISIKLPDRAKPIDFTIDGCFWMDSNQDEVFVDVAGKTCTDAIQGYNGTIFVYGQTGSGKTFSMYGPEGGNPAKMTADEKQVRMSQMGLVPRSMFFIFDTLANDSMVEDYTVQVTNVEIYTDGREVLRDLLVFAAPGKKRRRDKDPKLAIRELPNGDTYIENAKQVPCNSIRDFLSIMTDANGNRTVSATKMNATSSRSHSILQVFIEQKKRDGAVLKSKLNFVDLAGSERAKKTGATGQRMVEAQMINKTLLELGTVIKALSRGAKFVNFRNTILTYMLRDSLAGNTKTTLIVCCSPHIFNVAETISTLQFGVRCKLVKNKVKANKELSPEEMKKLIAKLREEIRRLRAGLPGQLEDEMIGEGPAGPTAMVRTSGDSPEQAAGPSPGRSPGRSPGKLGHNTSALQIQRAATSRLSQALAEETMANQKELEAMRKMLEDKENSEKQMQEELATQTDKMIALQTESLETSSKLKEEVAMKEQEMAKLQAEFATQQKMMEIQRDKLKLFEEEKARKKAKTFSIATSSGQEKFIEDAPDSPRTTKNKAIRDKKMRVMQEQLQSANSQMDKQHEALQSKNSQLMEMMSKVTKMEVEKAKSRTRMMEFMDKLKEKDNQLVAYDNKTTNLETQLDRMRMKVERAEQDLQEVKDGKALSKAMGKHKKEDTKTAKELEEQQKYLQSFTRREKARIA